VAYYLGIDGGGSKTICAIGDDIMQMATAVAGPSNITRVGEVRARESLHQVIRQASAAAKIDPQQIHRACIGVAGAGREEVASAVRKIVAEVIQGETKVVGDMEIALHAAVGAGPGVIVIGGTGSIAYGRNAQERTARAGGWGFAISDEGSAYWIGRASVAGLLREIDQAIGDGNEAQARADSLPLFRHIQAAWNIHSFDEFVRTANSNPDFAALFPSILTAANAGDGGAVRVLSQAGEELAQLAAIVARQLFVEDSTNVSAIPLGMVGGVFGHSQIVRESFRNAIRRIDPRAEVTPQVVEPVAGALQMARKPAETI
jgi:N-acetylglucosamine kinase-like BadF-type ATPase